MSCLNFEYSLVGQVLLDEAACCSPSFRSFHHQRQQDLFIPSSFLGNPYSNMLCTDDLSFYHADAPRSIGLSAPSPRTVERTLYPIYEADEEGKDYDDEGDEEDDDSGPFNAPFLRLFKSCLVQFAYMMPVDKAFKSPPPSPRKG